MADNDLLEDEIDQDLADDLDDELTDVLEDETGDKGKKRFPKIIVLIAGGALVLTVMVVLLWVFVFKKDPAQEEKSPMVVSKSIEKQPSSEPKEEEIIFQDIMTLEPFERIKLKENANMSLANLTVSLELVSPQVREEVAARTPEFRSIVREQVAQYTWLELRSSGGKIKFKYELLKKLNARLNRVLIRDVYFTHFIMQ